MFLLLDKQVIYRILRKETKYSNPHKRNASVPTLLAIVGHAARMVRLDTLTLFYNFLTYVYFYDISKYSRVSFDLN